MIETGGESRPTGLVGLQVVKPFVPTAAALKALATPQKGLPDEVNDWRSDNWREHVSQRGFPEIAFAEEHGIATQFGALLLAKHDHEQGLLVPLGLGSLRVVTDAGVAAIVDAFQGLFTLSNFRYHAIGTGTNVEAVGNTGLQTELTTQYNPDNTRATGTLTESAANVFQTVGTNNVDTAAAITEHAVMSQAATGGGTCLDRSVFSAVNLAIGDGLQSDYRLTVTSGG